MAPFYGLGSTASRLEPLRGGTLLFTTKFPKISGTHFTDLRRMKGWVYLGATQWFWARDPWIENPVPWPLGQYLYLHLHYLISLLYCSWSSIFSLSMVDTCVDIASLALSINTSLLSELTFCCSDDILL